MVRGWCVLGVLRACRPLPRPFRRASCQWGVWAVPWRPLHGLASTRGRAGRCHLRFCDSCQGSSLLLFMKHLLKTFVCFFAFILFFVLFFSLLAALRHFEFAGQGSDPSQRHNRNHSCGSMGSLTHCAEPGIEPASQQQRAAEPVASQQALLPLLLLLFK